LTACWPQYFASFSEIDVFHNPHNLLPRNLKCATVVTIHDLMALERPDLHLQGLERVMKRFYYPQAVWRALREATVLIAPSKATADRICAFLPAATSRVKVIWEAADACFQPAENLPMVQERAASILGGDWPYLLVVGANVPAKRHDLALEAFTAAVPPPWRLVLVQRRKSSGLLVRRGHDLQIQDRLIWREAVTVEDLVALLQGAGALIQPSVYEGFGLPVLEAMACGCPVVCSDLPALREITAGAAMLVRPNECESLASALRQIVASQELRRSLAAQSWAQARNFSWDRCAQETLEVYHAAAGR
jgi:glycosyltransferase involved in cell wall biosynthesis